MSKQQSHKERRQFPRLAAQLEVRFKLLEQTEDQFKKDITNSIGKGGCFIRTKNPFPLKSEVELELTVKNRTVQAQGEVRYVIPFDLDAGGLQFPGMGIMFTMIPNDDQEFISKFVESGLKKGQPSA